MIVMELPRKPHLRINVIANYAGKFWSAVSAFVFVPIYINILGIEHYGLVAIYTTALGFLFFLDAGLSAAFARETAKERDRKKLCTLLASIERVLFAILLFVGVLIYLTAPYVTEYLISKENNLGSQAITYNVRLMVFAILPQIIISLYIGGLMGLQRQVLANVMTITFGIVRSGLVIVPLYIFNEVTVFFIWHAIASFSFLLLLRVMLANTLGANKYHIGNFSVLQLKEIRSYAIGMLLISLLSSINIQIDKLVVSTLRPLIEFSYYFVAATISQIPVLVTTPLALALLPRLTELISCSKPNETQLLYEKASYYMAAIGSSSSFILFFFGEEIIKMWTGQKFIPEDISTVIQILTIGGLFLSIQLMPYYLSLANGHNSTNVKFGFITVFLLLPSQIYLTKYFGIVGAALPWLLINILSFIYLSFRLNSLFNQGRYRIWFFKLTFTPILFSFFLLLAGRTFADYAGLTNIYAIVLAILTGSLALLCSHLLWPKVKSEILKIKM